MIELLNVVKQFGSPEGGLLTVLDMPVLAINDGETVGIAGPSGTGKTTLVNVIAGILAPTSGRVTVNGVNLYDMSEARRDRFRAQNIGYVFQNFNLIPSLSAWENVMAALHFGKAIPAAARADRCRELFSRVGLSARMRHRPGELSGGEQQRVCIARALANHPPILLADEPTANLDLKNRQVVMELLRDVCSEDGVTLLVATHDQHLLSSLSRVIELNGKEEAHALSNRLA